MKEQELENAYNDLHKLSEEYWGTYSLNKFFIQINTRKPRSAVPSYDFEDYNLAMLINPSVLTLLRGHIMIHPVLPNIFDKAQ